MDYAHAHGSRRGLGTSSIAPDEPARSMSTARVWRRGSICRAAWRRQRHVADHAARSLWNPHAPPKRRRSAQHLTHQSARTDESHVLSSLTARERGSSSNEGAQRGSIPPPLPAATEADQSSVRISSPPRNVASLGRVSPPSVEEADASSACGVPAAATFATSVTPGT